MDFSFPKKEKLKSKKAIEQLFSEGKSLSKHPLKLIYLKTSLPNDLQFQVAVTAPKKKFKTAVQRNRIKRLLRESYRRNKHIIFNNIEGDFALLFLYLGKETPSYTQMENDMKELLQKFSRNINDSPGV